MPVRPLPSVSSALLLTSMLLLPGTLHAATTVLPSRGVRATEDCASTLSLSLPGARITEARAVTHIDSARAL